MRVAQDIPRKRICTSYPLRRLRRAGEARARLETAFEILKRLKFYPAEKIYPGSELQEVLQSRADSQADRDLAGALKLYQDFIDRLQPAKAGLQPSLTDAVRISGIYQAAAALYRRAEQAEMARAFEARRRNIWLEWQRKLPGNTFVLRQITAQP